MEEGQASICDKLVSHNGRNVRFKIVLSKPPVEQVPQERNQNVEERIIERLPAVVETQQDLVNRINSTRNFSVSSSSKVPISRRKKSRKHLNLAWSPYETDKFYEAVRLFGLDFGLMSTRFRNRSRPQLKRKYLQEEKSDQAALTWAIKNPLEVPEELNPFSLPLPCQLKGWNVEELEKTYYPYLVLQLERQKKEQAGKEGQEVVADVANEMEDEEEMEYNDDDDDYDEDDDIDLEDEVF